MKNKHTIYTDGSCLNNGKKNNSGGYCGILISENGNETIVKGRENNTTNNRMELKAIIESIKCIPNKSNTIIIYSDSKITVDAINTGLAKWQAKNWKTSAKTPVANQDLWKEYLEVSKNHIITAQHVKGHSGDKYNEKCDAISVQEAKSLQPVDSSTIEY